MILLHLTSAVLLIGILSAVTQAGPSKMSGFSPRRAVPVRGFDNDFGIAFIKYFKQGRICTGVHLKPWILLTPAKCVRGREIKKLYAKVYYKYKNRAFSNNVRIIDITYQTDKPKKHEPDFALLYIHSKIDWDTDEFAVPKHNYTSGEIIEKAYKTKIAQWWTTNFEQYNNLYCDVKVTEEPICGSSIYTEPSFCVKTSKCQGKFTANDVGLPLFYMRYKDSSSNQNSKVLLGVYTGQHLGKDTEASYFEPVFTASDFIINYIQEHPIPAF